jgi:dsDNA-specific endonuclease/ATPase MutS2
LAKTINMTFQPGDIVRFVNEEGEAKVIRHVTADVVRVELSKGLEVNVRIREIVHVRREVMHHVSTKAKDSLPDRSKVKKHTGKPATEWIIDLHAENLPIDTRLLPPATILNAQLDYFARSLEKAILGHAIKIIFIHGVGNGKLRESIIKQLKNYEGLEHSDASLQKYGAGATEVRIVSRNKARRF